MLLLFCYWKELYSLSILLNFICRIIFLKATVYMMYVSRRWIFQNLNVIRDCWGLVRHYGHMPMTWEQFLTLAPLTQVLKYVINGWCSAISCNTPPRVYGAHPILVHSQTIDWVTSKGSLHVQRYDILMTVYVDVNWLLHYLLRTRVHLFSTLNRRLNSLSLLQRDYLNSATDSGKFRFGHAHGLQVDSCKSVILIL